MLISNTLEQKFHLYEIAASQFLAMKYIHDGRGFVCSGSEYSTCDNDVTKYKCEHIYPKHLRNYAFTRLQNSIAIHRSDPRLGARSVRHNNEAVRNRSRFGNVRRITNDHFQPHIAGHWISKTTTKVLEPCELSRPLAMTYPLLRQLAISQPLLHPSAMP